MKVRRLIDGNRLDAVLRNIADHLAEAGEKDFAASVYVIADIVKKQPTIDAIEVIRCKNCKFWQQDHDIDYCESADGFDRYVGPNDFCSCGMQKEGAKCQSG